MEDLIFAVKEHILAMDELMKLPSTYDRGRKIATRIGKLQTAMKEAEEALQQPNAADAKPRCDRCDWCFEHFYNFCNNCGKNLRR